MTQPDKNSREALAWRITVASFIAFLLLLAGLIYVTQWFVFRSTTPLDVEVVVGRGTVSVVLPTSEEPLAVTERRSDLELGTLIQTDSTSQAIINFRDPRNGTVVTSITLFRDSSIVVDQTAGPRFRVNRNPYSISVIDVVGRIEVLAHETSTHDLVLLALTENAQIMQLDAGHQMLVATDDQTQVLQLSGQSEVTNLNTDEELSLKSNEQTVAHGDEDLEPTDAPYSLLLNSQFERSFDTDWLFYNDRVPPGQIENTVFENRSVVVIDRSQGRFDDPIRDHGETGLVQPLDLDVSDFSYLEFRASFYVEEQSLASCGVKASECPLMVRFEYLDADGLAQVFIHGFYATHDPSLAWPVACDTCRSEHERVNLGTWYTYESGNLRTLWPEEQQPQKIVQVSFYASGWAYRVYVSNVDLLASD